MGSDFQNCIDACKACHNLCTQEVARLIETIEPSSLGNMEIESLIKSAAMCETAGKALHARRSLAEIICVTCAANCEETAALLSPYANMFDCARAARECAISCRAVASGRERFDGSCRPFDCGRTADQ
jgi:hypothetical protein